MPYKYYMTPAERQRYEQQKLFNTIASIGTKQPYYALGLAIGQGLGNAYGEMADQREGERLDAYVNGSLSPSTQVQMQDQALKEMLQPDAQKEMLSLANAKPGTMNPIGETKYIQTPKQQGFTAPSTTDISEFARTHSISRDILNSRMGDYQQQIQDRAREYYIPMIGEMVENGALTNTDGLAKLASTLGQYGQYDEKGAKNISSALSGLMKPASAGRTAGGTSLMNAWLGNTGRTAQGNNQGYKFADLVTLRKQYVDALNTANSTGNLATAEAIGKQLDNLDGLLSKTLYPTSEAPAGNNAPINPDDYTNFREQFPEEYEDKPYAELAREMGVLPQNIENIGRADYWDEKPQQAKPTEPQQVKPASQSQPSYSFNVENDIQRLNALRNPKDGSELSIEQKRNFITNNPVWTKEQKAALLEKLR